MSDLVLFWHRRDLRISDHKGLALARELSDQVVGIFCLDPNILLKDDVAPARVSYMIGCLQELQESYAKANSQLLIIRDQPSQGIPRVASALKAKAVVWSWDVEPYSKERDRMITESLQNLGIATHNCWDQLLHFPADIRTGSDRPYTVYTPFWKKWIDKPKSEPIKIFQNRITLTEAEQAAAREAGAIALPTAKDLGFSWSNELLLAPGETAAKERLAEFCATTIFTYQEQRNFPAVDGTSRLSAALKFGAIGIRTVWNASIEAMAQTRSESAQAGVKTWQQELAWREFYQHAMYHFPELASGAFREVFKTFPYDNNEAYFQAWCEGKTGYPIVDAAMRQMNETGWMHNRCRMIVANFLTKDLLIDPSRGEKYFMQKLFDGDISANNGGWQWSASSGMDAKPLRIFNPASQAQKFDAEAEYIKQWLPELRSLDAESLVTGKITPIARISLGYPTPIVDHNQQQREFKNRYSQQKSN